MANSLGCSHSFLHDQMGIIRTRRPHRTSRRNVEHETHQIPKRTTLPTELEDLVHKMVTIDTLAPISILLIMTKRIVYLPCCAYLFKSFTKTNHRHISQEVGLFFKPGLVYLLFLVENILIRNSPTRAPPMLFALARVIFFYTAILVIVIILRLFTFIHHWHHIRARRIWLACKELVLARFLPICALFISSLFVPGVALTSPKETSFSFHHETQLITFFGNLFPILRPEKERHRSGAGRSGSLPPLSDRYGQMENIGTLP